MSKNESQEYKERVREITAVLRKHGVTRGFTPEKFRLILEDLGPTFIKIGQIMSMHSDVLPKRYCDELMKLCSQAVPMPFEEVKEVIEESCGGPPEAFFSGIEEEPLGAASIAQVHRAVLKNGAQVVIKVQRKDIYKTMARDIKVLRRAVKLLPAAVLKGTVDLDMVLDELWAVTREELNFIAEASNLEEFAGKNKDVAFVGTPRLYQEYTSMHMLVMEYIDGYDINDKEALLENGYDLREVGTKLVDNYIKQVMDDGFFHADPHAGNIKVREGKIVWIDMGMMGRLTERDRQLVGKAIRGIADNDIEMIREVVLALGEFKEKPDKHKLYEDIRGLIDKYGRTDMASINVAEVMMDLMEVMKKNRIIMPHGLTMLARSLTHMEGLLVELVPDINMVEIASKRIAEEYLKDFDWKQEMKNRGKGIYKSVHKALDIPVLVSDLLQGYLKGQSKIKLDLNVSDEFSKLLRHLIRNVVMGLWVMALLIGSSIICTTDMRPKILGIPAIGMIGYMIAFCIVMYVFIKHFLSR